MAKRRQHYLITDGLLIIDESHVTVPQIGAMYKGDRSRKENLVEYGFRLPSALDNRPMKFEEFEALAPQTIYVSATPSNYEVEKSGDDIAQQVVRPTGLLDPVEERVLATTLTKRMAEDLTDYLDEHGIKTRYLHSDVDTVERVEIIRDFRLGKFDVLVGINLLREGLDMPEVSLVAILDADKEGFLRSERSLIQTIGRAARNINGRAILYAARITGSMKKAIDETERRRGIQHQYNLDHGITPKGVRRKISDVMGLGNGTSKASLQKVAEQHASYKIMSTKEIDDKIKLLESEMIKHAQNLEFELAAKARDEIASLRNQQLST